MRIRATGRLHVEVFAFRTILELVVVKLHYSSFMEIDGVVKRFNNPTLLASEHYPKQTPLSVIFYELWGVRQVFKNMLTQTALPV